MILRERQKQVGEAAVSEDFVEVDVLSLSSVELADRHGATLRPFGLRDLPEVTAAVEEALPGAVPSEKLASVLSGLEAPFPCYLGKQDLGPGTGGEFLTDGTRCRWTIFFEPGGELTVVTRDGGPLAVAQRPVEARAAVPLTLKQWGQRLLESWRKRGSADRI